MTERIDPMLASALDDAFPGRDVERVRPAGPSWNDQNETVCVRFADGERVFLKVAADGDGSRIARERAVIDYVGAHCDVAVPSVIASETAGATPHLVTAPMRGRTLADEWAERSVDERAAILRQVGSALAEIHSRSFERHGHVRGGDADELVLETGTWTEVLVDRIALLQDLASTDRFANHFDEVVAAVEANRDRLNDAPATLVHGDPARPNCVRDETGVGFVDWEIAAVGDPGRELHRTRDQLVPTDETDSGRPVTALREGYERRAGSLPAGLEDRTPVYDAVSYLGKSGFFDKWVEFTDASPADLATQVDDEMNRRLEKIR